jgi:diacylglycerol kinase (ATP)
MSNGKRQRGKAGRSDGLGRLWRATGYSLAGLGAAYKNEAAFRQEVWLAAVLIPLTFLLPLSLLFQVVLVATVLGVLVTELLNSSLEAVVDLASPDHQPLAKRAKDMGSAAVLVSLIILVIAWGLALAVVFGC